MQDVRHLDPEDREVAKVVKTSIQEKLDGIYKLASPIALTLTNYAVAILSTHNLQPPPPFAAMSGRLLDNRCRRSKPTIGLATTTMKTFWRRCCRVELR
ncbi:unnamed protein product [Lactuca saligna]|uniref:Uncharacterized protein n=1 Tax=Lactuca saligna TaxID=75948 RepID=A0AA36E6X7_LACSI|nr:unnamed protein product [Lactuca saligna]